MQHADEMAMKNVCRSSCLGAECSRIINNNNMTDQDYSDYQDQEVKALNAKREMPKDRLPEFSKDRNEYVRLQVETYTRLFADGEHVKISKELFQKVLENSYLNGQFSGFCQAQKIING